MGFDNKMCHGVHEAGVTDPAVGIKMNLSQFYTYWSKCCIPNIINNFKIV